MLLASPSRPRLLRAALAVPLALLAASSPSGPQLPDDAHDRLFVVTVPARGEARALELRYGDGP